MKYLLSILFLLVATTACASVNVYHFSATWCSACPKAIKILKEKDVAELVVQYDVNYIIDIDEYPDWKRNFNIKTIPTTLIVELDDKNKIKAILYTWNPANGKDALKTALKKHLPKRDVKLKRPLLELLKKPVKILAGDR